MALYNPNEQFGYATTPGAGPSGWIQTAGGLMDSTNFENGNRLMDEGGNTFQALQGDSSDKYTAGLNVLQGPNGRSYLGENDFQAYGSRLPKEDGWISKLGPFALALPALGFLGAGGASFFGAGAGGLGATGASAGGEVAGGGALEAGATTFPLNTAGDFFQMGAGEGFGAGGAGASGAASMLGPQTITRLEPAAAGFLGGGGGGMFGGNALMNALSIGSGIYGLTQADRMKKLALQASQQADPFGPMRAGYQSQLANLEANPSLIQGLPGYQAGLQAVQRTMGAQGYQGSGNMATALQKYGGDAFNAERAFLGNAAGMNINPANGAQMLLQGNQAGIGLAGQSLASIGYGLGGGISPAQQMLMMLMQGGMR